MLRPPPPCPSLWKPWAVPLLAGLVTALLAVEMGGSLSGTALLLKASQWSLPAHGRVTEGSGQAFGMSGEVSSVELESCNLNLI